MLVDRRFGESDKENTKVTIAEGQFDSEDSVSLIQLRRSARTNKGKRSSSFVNTEIKATKQEKVLSKKKTVSEQQLKFKKVLNKSNRSLHLFGY